MLLSNLKLDEILRIKNSDAIDFTNPYVLTNNMGDGLILAVKSRL